jgi:hypothetical protein
MQNPKIDIGGLTSSELLKLHAAISGELPLARITESVDSLRRAVSLTRLRGGPSFSIWQALSGSILNGGRTSGSCAVQLPPSNETSPPGTIFMRWTMSGLEGGSTPWAS